MKRTKIPLDIMEPGRVWLRKMLKTYEFQPGEYDLLFEAARSLNRLDECRTIISAEGLSIQDKFLQTRAHPLCAVERDNRLVFLRICKQLNVLGDGKDDK